MDKSLPDWLRPWLNLPGWQLLLIQWLLLLAVLLLTTMLLVRGTWQQLEQLRAQQQGLARQIAERQQQLARLPVLEELERRLQQQTVATPPEPENLGSRLHQVGGLLLRWQQQESPTRHIVKLQVDFGGLLQLLAGLSSQLRLDQMTIERQPDGLLTQLILSTPQGEAHE